MAFRFHRGDRLQDIVTGFAGVVIGRSDYLTGCNRYLLAPPLNKDGAFVDAIWFDEHSVEIDPAHNGERLSLDRRQEDPPG